MPHQADIFHFIQKFKKQDAVIITALRDNEHKETVLDNNKDLYSALFALNYPITELDSSYIKDYQKILNLDNDFFTGSYLVVNRFGKSDFIDNMTKLAQYYGQPHIFVIKDGKHPTAYLLGTQDPHMGQFMNYPDCHEHIGNPKFFKKYRQRDFYFTGAMKDGHLTNSQMVGVYQPTNWLGRMACSSMGKRVLRQVGIEYSNP